MEKVLVTFSEEDLKEGSKYYHLLIKCPPGVSLHLKKRKPKLNKKQIKRLTNKRKAKVKTAKKFNHDLVPKKDRLQHLIKMAKIGSLVSNKATVTARKYFDTHKQELLPLTGAYCYCCSDTAKARHHVIPLSKGGTNSKKNLVPLCESCHMRVHPWLDFMEVPTI